MRADLPPDAALLEQNADLRSRLHEAEQTLQAIRAGAVDALVVETSAGPQIFLLQGIEAESYRLRSEMLAQVSDAVIATDNDESVTYLNAAAERQYGVTEVNVLGRKLSWLYETRWLRPEDKAAEMTALRDLGHWRGEKVHVTHSGKAINIDCSMTRMVTKDGMAYGRLAVFRDITHQKGHENLRKLLEKQLHESQKMEALGTLAGGVAHDFNNILGTIMINVQLARRDATANWRALVSLEEIDKAARRASDLVRQILAFGRQQSNMRQVISIPSAVEESVRLLRAALNGKVLIDYQCAPDTPSVVADMTQVQQVVLNLGNNAAYAMEGRAGNITIRVEGVVLDEASMQRHHNLLPGKYARIVVSDAGHGMDVATQQRIFEPFFTTKPQGQGTGLGLAVVHGILRTHKAEIVVHSEPGRGSRFEVYFPAVNEVAAALGPDTMEPAGMASEGRGRHILYIDDDQPQLYANKRMLESWGYRVSAYYAQREALQAVLAGEIRCDLLVTDFNMPGTSGLEVARAIHLMLPELPIIMVSGFITDELREQAAAAGVRRLIGKPQDMEELRDILQSLLTPPLPT